MTLQATHSRIQRTDPSNSFDTFDPELPEEAEDAHHDIDPEQSRHDLNRLGRNERGPVSLEDEELDSILNEARDEEALDGEQTEIEEELKNNLEEFEQSLMDLKTNGNLTGEELEDYKSRAHEILNEFKEGKLRGNLVNRSVAAPRDHQRRTAGQCLPHQCLSVAVSFRHEDAPINTSRGEHCLGIGNPPFRQLRPPASARDWIHDDGNALGRYGHFLT